MHGRLRLALLGVVLLFVGGCDAASADTPFSQWPAGASGRLCQVLEYDEVAATLGITFDTAGAAKQDDTMTCALTQVGHSYPYLTLAVSASTADALTFNVIVKPNGSQQLDGLGAAAYTLPIPPVNDAGPALEIGWLSPSRRLLLLHYGFAPEATDADVAQLTPKLVTLAHQVETGLLATTAPLGPSRLPTPGAPPPAGAQSPSPGSSSAPA